MNGKTVIQSGQTAAVHAPSVRSINVERGTGGGGYYSVYVEDTYFFPRS